MLFDGHPAVDRKNWNSFCSNLNPYFSRAIGREQGEFPYWFAPLARGVVVASSILLLRIADKRALLDWTHVSAHVYQRVFGKTRLRVRRTNDGKLWLISRWPPGVSINSERRSETLVHTFGSTPLVADSLIEALYLAYWFQTNDPIGGLRWVRVSPVLLGNAIALADQRARSEGLKVSWNDLWASGAHARRMKSGRARYRNGKLMPPIIVRMALGIAA